MPSWEFIMVQDFPRLSNSYLLSLSQSSQPISLFLLLSLQTKEMSGDVFWRRRLSLLWLLFRFLYQPLPWLPSCCGRGEYNHWQNLRVYCLIWLALLFPALWGDFIQRTHSFLYWLARTNIYAGIPLRCFLSEWNNTSETNGSTTTGDYFSLICSSMDWMCISPSLWSDFLMLSPPIKP